MKTLSKVLLVFALGFCIFGFGLSVSAQETDGYTVSYDGEYYSLYSALSEASTPIMSTSSFTQICEYIYSASSKASVNFSGVTVKEGFYLKSGDYTFSGDIEFLDNAGITVDGGKITLSSLDIKLGSGSIRIKRGSLEMLSGSIFSEADTAILLDYSSGASFSLLGGEISTSSNTASILLKYGTLTIGGGSIKNSSGVAISSHSTLVLYGTPEISGFNYGIEASMPITLAYEDYEYSGSVRVRYLEEFQKGSVSCVAYMASENALAGISLFDRNGTLMRLKYFSSYESIDEFNFGAVYIPYTAEFIDNGSVLQTEYLLLGEILEVPEKPEKPEKEGYKFIGWRCSSESGELYEFSSPVESDIKLYASYELEKPVYELLSLSFVYDGCERKLKFDKITHPLLSEGLLTYSWYKDGVAIQNFSECVNIKNVSDSGMYYCSITFTVAGESITLDTIEVEARVSKAEIAIPKILPVYYNGEYQYPDIYSTDSYTVKETGGVIVGAYPILITLLDSENNKFSGSDSESVYVDFVIQKAENKWREELKIYDVYTGMTPSPVAISQFGEVGFIYSDREDGVYTSVAPTVPGAYYVKAFVEENENYYAIESAARSFNVIEEKVSGIAVVKMPDKLEYTAFEEFLADGILIGVTYNSGRTETVGAESVTISYGTGESLRYNDTSVTVSYGGASAVLRVSVKKAEYDISQIIFSDAAVEYDSSYKTLQPLGELPIGLDGIPLCAVAEGGSAEAGVYTVKLKFYTESENYLVPENMYATLTVTPKSTEIIWDNTVFVYDGSVKAPTAYYIDIHGRKVSLSVSGGRSYAGQYTAVASGADRNYELLNPTVLFRVNKADYDMSGVVWSESLCYYDGTEKRITLIELPAGVSVLGYLNNKATEAGEYLAVASLGYDEYNYNPPEPVSCVWKILPAEYSIVGFSFSDAEYEYDGEPHYPIFNGEMPIGVDGICLEYRYGEGIVHVSRGVAAVEIIFSTASKNYTPPENMTAYVKITPKPIAVSWHSLEFVYTSEKHIPYALAAESEIFVSGAASEAGSYTAYATALDSDYIVINAQMNFIIHKAENKWITVPDVKDVFYGKSPSPAGEAFAGEVAYIYYADADGNQEIEIPREVGSYYVKAIGEGDGNYLPIESDCLPFSIIAIVPIGISVQLERNEYTAFDLILPNYFSAYLNNNDGSSTLLRSDEISVRYLNGGSLRAADKTASFVYGDFTAEVEIKVNKRDYDLSGVSWHNLLHIYDGTQKSAQVSGLPEGVTVLSYDGNGAQSAGEYTVNVSLDYDSENYNEPIISPVTMRIEKQTVFISAPESCVYSGVPIMPNLVQSELFSCEFTPVRDAGNYAVVFNLKDSENYMFMNGEGELSLPFTVEKRRLTVKVSDVDLYLFEKDIPTSYSIIDGELVSGDALVCSYIVGEDEVVASFTSPNYEIEVIPGSINRIKALSQESLTIFLIIVFALIAGIIALLAVILNKNRLYRYYRAVLCRASAFDDETDAEYEANCEVQSPESLNNSILYEDDNAQKEEAVSEVCEENDCSEAAPSSEIFDAALEESAYSNLINADYADNAITDSLARDLIRKDENIVMTEGYKKGIINVDTLSRSFVSGDKVDINLLKEKSLVPYDTAYIKVLARGVIDKPLEVYANDFSLSAVKMIALAGGKSVRVNTVTRKKNGNR